MELTRERGRGESLGDFADWLVWITYRGEYWSVLKKADRESVLRDFISVID